MSGSIAVQHLPLMGTGRADVSSGQREEGGKEKVPFGVCSVYSQQLRGPLNASAYRPTTIITTTTTITHMK